MKQIFGIGLVMFVLLLIPSALAANSYDVYNVKLLHAPYVITDDRNAFAVSIYNQGTETKTNIELQFVEKDSTYGKSVLAGYGTSGLLDVYGRPGADVISSCPGLSAKQALSITNFAVKSDKTYTMFVPGPVAGKTYLAVIGTYNNCGEGYTGAYVLDLPNAKYLTKAQCDANSECKARYSDAMKFLGFTEDNTNGCPVSTTTNSCIPVGCSFKDISGIIGVSTSCCSGGQKVYGGSTNLFAGLYSSDKGTCQDYSYWLASKAFISKLVTEFGKFVVALIIGSLLYLAFKMARRRGWL